MEKGHEVIAKSSHLTFSMVQWILQDPASRAIKVLLSLLCLPNPLFLRCSFRKRPLSNIFLKEHNNKCADLITLLCRVFLWTLCEEHWYLIAFHHHVWEEEFKTILELFSHTLVVVLGVRLLLVGLLVDTHVGFTNHFCSFFHKSLDLFTVMIGQLPWCIMCKVKRIYQLCLMLICHSLNDSNFAQKVFLYSQRLLLEEDICVNLEKVA
jgi:uncharacterized membrane protein